MTTALNSKKVALVMAGGTGGHIFPAMAVAFGLMANGWDVHWLGSKKNMEWDLVAPTGIPFESIDFSGVRGKSRWQILTAPWRLLKAIVQAWQVVSRVQPTVLLGFGGYITVPAGLVGILRGKALILHEQNSIAGMANRVLAKGAKASFTAFPDALPNAQWVGNPLRQAFLEQAAPAQRFAHRVGPLKLLVVGGSLGATALNSIIPDALALIPVAQRPEVIHQSGRNHVDSLRTRYTQLGVDAQTTPFIDDTATAFAQADLVICRAGASTVTELAAIGVAAVFVPFPAAVDDHQTANARYLSDAGAAWLMPQAQLTAQALAQFLMQVTRQELATTAEKAYALKKLQAVETIVNATENLTA